MIVIVPLTMLLLASVWLMNTYTMGKMLKRIDALEKNQEVMKSEYTNLFLTPEDRKLLGLNEITVPKPEPVLPILKTSKPKKEPNPSEMPACLEHTWSAAELDSVRRYSANSELEDEDGYAYVRHCLSCKWRQARGRRVPGTSDMYYWHDD